MGGTSRGCLQAPAGWAGCCRHSGWRWWAGPWTPWSHGRQEEAERFWKESWELEEHDVQLPRPLSTTESEEACSAVSSSAEGEEAKEAKEAKEAPRGAYPRAAGEKLR